MIGIEWHGSTYFAILRPRFYEWEGKKKRMPGSYVPWFAWQRFPNEWPRLVIKNGLLILSREYRSGAKNRWRRENVSAHT